MKNEYLLAVKKAIIDFVLTDSLYKKKALTNEMTTERLELKSLTLVYKHKLVFYIFGRNYITYCYKLIIFSFFAVRFLDNRRMIKRNLFLINPCIEQILEIWHTTYSNINLVDVRKLSDHKGAFELAEFTVNLCVICITNR